MNFVMNTFAIVAISNELDNPDIHTRKPHTKKEDLITFVKINK
jgi:hypothetical protein